jgi:hypothetical protein
MVIRELQFDCLEAGRRRSRKAFDQRALGKQIGKVGGETGHGELFA